MLKAFRDNLKYLSWILWLVIAVFILFMVADFGGTVPGPALPTQAAATVDDEEISYGELQRAYRQTEESYRQAYGANFTPELAQQLQLPMQVLDQLVQQRILLKEAERIGLAVSDTELQKELLRLPVFQDQNGNFIGEDQYEQALRSYGFSSPEEFEEGMRSDLLLSKLNRALSDNIVVTDADIEQAYRQDAEKAKIKYVRVPLERFRDDDPLAVEDVEAYFQSHIENFRLPERRAVEYLLIDPDVVRQDMQVSDEELQAYYTENAEFYSNEEQVRARQILLLVNDERTEEQAQQELEAIRARVAAGEDFAQLATELSDDTFTAPQGGEMAPFGRGQILPEVETAAFAAQPGEVVGPIRSGSAYHLLEILEHTPGGLPPFEVMKGTVSLRLLAERSREAAEAKATELSDRIAREQIATAEAIEALSQDDAAVSFRTTQPFGRSDNVPSIGRSTQFSETAFELEAGSVSDPIRVGSGWAIVRLANIEEPRLPELTEVEAEARTELRDIKAREQALERLVAAREEVVGGSSLEDLATTYEATVEESVEFTGQGQIGGTLGVNPELAAAALGLEVDGIGAPIVVGSDVVLYQVAERAHFDAAEFALARDTKRDEIASQRLGELISTVVAERRDEMEITYDPNVQANLGLAGS